MLMRRPSRLERINFKCEFNSYWLPYSELLRGCLSYFYPVNFASKIILPETLSTERLYLGKN